MHKLDLDAFRTTLETGGILSVSLVAQGGAFHVEAETRRGDAVLTKSRSTVLREFRNVQRATLLLRELGVREFSVDTKNWRPEQADIGRATRPDRAAVLREALAAAEIQRSLDAAIKQADDPNTVWVAHDDLFDAIEADLAN
ncbi:hypothetical protein [Sulfuriferula nivalis]|uniref:Prevent host death protein, Phd antitoxin n=1 Tax=Sulfuriferula nivalis TaxID=2675298 RepID=A0A809S548_9PROT|nr:hypothetical protein [Sulfuriferula nivalis]BBP02278.1 hypothetical protein SFSGTM_29860 [Sulfuriferula nivalis]